MKNSPIRGIEVFDFKDETELAQIASDKPLGKFKNPSLDDQPSFKEGFFGYVSEENLQIKDIGSISSNADAFYTECDFDKAVPKPVLSMSENSGDEMKFSKLECTPQLDALCNGESLSYELNNNQKYRSSIEPGTKTLSGTVSLTEIRPLEFTLSQSPSNNGSHNMCSDAEESMDNSSSSSHDSEIAEDDVSLKGYASNQRFNNSSRDDADMEVLIYPDYVLCRDFYYTTPQLTFSPGCVKLSGLTANRSQETFNFEWAVDDIIDIKSQLFHSVETVMIKICVISSDVVRLNNVCGASGIEELNIAVVDPNWSQIHKKITSLNLKYSAIWNIISELNMESNVHGSLGCKLYFPYFDEQFDEVIYPKGDPDAVTISKRDVDLLQPETFINDTIIDFYIKYLKNQIDPAEKHRFHFFNSFFFRKLADLDKNPSSASDGKAAFQRVRKWTRKIDLFEKDYIFIPVNFNLHWSLLIICHPGEMVNFKDEDPYSSLKVPCILHLDSIKGNHSGLKNLLQSYLLEEWKERRKDLEEDLSSRFLNMRFVPLELPQQENSFDCGLFLLHYLELFLADAPANFSPFKLNKFSNFLSADWFHPAEASLKRSLIQRLIFELLDNHSREISSSSDREDQHKYPNNDNETGVEFISEHGSPEIKENPLSSHTGQGIEITLLSASSLDSDTVNNSGLVLRELFESGATAGSLLGQCQSFDHRTSNYHLNGSIFPIEEDKETGEQFIYMTSGDANFQQIAGIQQTCTIPHFSRDFESYKPELSLDAEHGKANLPLDRSYSDSDDSDDIGVIDYPVNRNTESGEMHVLNESESPFCTQENQRKRKSPPVETIECTRNLPPGFALDSSQDSGEMCDRTEDGVIPSSCQENLATQCKGPFIADDWTACDDIHVNGSGLESPEQQTAAKRTGLTPPPDCENDLMECFPQESGL